MTGVQTCALPIYGYGSRYGYYDDLDLAGLCFDPSGERMYVAGNGFGSGGGNGGVNSDVAGAGAVVEWGVDVSA